jgi:hypothetical protein
MKSLAAGMMFLAITSGVIAQESPRLLLQINNAPQVSYRKGIFGGVDQRQTDYLGSEDKVREDMVKRYKVPIDAFTQKQDKADYILKIATEGANCRWTVYYNDRTPDGEPKQIGSKLVTFCANAIKDVINAAFTDWKNRVR